MAYSDAVASDIRPLPMFCEIIASNMISHDRVTDSKCFPINNKISEIMRIVRVLSKVNMCVQMRVRKHGSDIMQTLIGYVLSDARFDWPVGNMRAYQQDSLYC